MCIRDRTTVAKTPLEVASKTTVDVAAKADGGGLFNKFKGAADTGTRISELSGRLGADVSGGTKIAQLDPSAATKIAINQPIKPHIDPMVPKSIKVGKVKVNPR